MIKINVGWYNNLDLGKLDFSSVLWVAIYCLFIGCLIDCTQNWQVLAENNNSNLIGWHCATSGTSPPGIKGVFTRNGPKIFRSNM